MKFTFFFSSVYATIYVSVWRSLESNCVKAFELTTYKISDVWFKSKEMDKMKLRSVFNLLMNQSS